MCEVPVQRAWLVLCDHAYALDPRIEAARESKIEQPVFARKGQCSFGSPGSECSQTCPDIIGDNEDQWLAKPRSN
jgi:hypothetical protein